jgi:hypothetical protein
MRPSFATQESDSGMLAMPERSRCSLMISAGSRTIRLAPRYIDELLKQGREETIVADAGM